MELCTRVVSGEAVRSNILKAEQTRLLSGYDKGYERKREIKDDCKIFLAKHLEEGVVVKLGGEDIKEEVFWGKIGSSVLDMSRMTYLIQHSS